MTAIGEVLRRLERRLDLPQPTKSRLLLEIAADVRDLERHLTEGGMSADDARRRAIDEFDLSDDNIERLVGIHASPYRRFLDRLGAQARTRWERSLAAVTLVCAAVLVGGLASSAELFRVAGPSAWAAVGLGLVALAIGAHKAYLAFLRQDHDAVRLRRGLGAVLALAVIDALVGALGAWGSLYHLWRSASTDAGQMVPLLTAWLRSSSASLVVGLLTAIAVALVWFVLAGKIARIEQAEAEAMLGLSD